MAEPEKIVNVFELMANADPKVLEAIFEGLRPMVRAMEPNAPAFKPTSSPEPKKT